MIALSHNPLVQAGDLNRKGKNLIPDNSLETAVYLSLFTHRLAEPDDTLPDPSGDRQGFWGDAFPLVANRKWGSRLWLLSRTKINPESPELLNLAKVYAVEALQWLIEDNAASTVDVVASFQTLTPSSEFGLALQVTITRPGNPNPWSKLWVANLALL